MSELLSTCTMPDAKPAARKATVLLPIATLGWAGGGSLASVVMVSGCGVSANRARPMPLSGEPVMAACRLRIRVRASAPVRLKFCPPTDSAPVEEAVISTLALRVSVRVSEPLSVEDEDSD